MATSALFRRTYNSPRRTRTSTRCPSALASNALLSQPIDVPIKRLRPTQVAVGMRAVAAKSKRIGSQKAIHRYVKRRPIPAVFGPGNRYYIVDHHHLSLALLRNSVETAKVKIIGDFSDLSAQQFWAAMEIQSLVYPFDETGRRVSLCGLPNAITEMKADTYRDLAWSVREAGGYKKTDMPFAEFKWAEFFRDTVPAALLERDYSEAVSRAKKLARSPSAAGLPGYSGRSR